MNQSALAQLPRSRLTVCLVLAVVLAFNFAIRWHLRDMPLERDEGEYAYAGQLILQGVPPYKLAFNMKFPGSYFIYALLMAIFGQSAPGIHCGIILVISLTALLIFFIGRELLSDSGALIATAIYVCLAALPKAAGLAGHATHFVSLFACAGISALLMARKKNSLMWWFISGTAFGLGILMKQHAVFFPAFIIVWYLWNEFRRTTRQTLALVILIFCAGCVIPFLATVIGFACAGLLHAFMFWTFEYARQYVSMLPLRAAPGQFATGFGPLFESGVWVWIFGIAGLICLFRKGESQADAKVSENPQSEISNKCSPGLAAVMFLAAIAATVPGFYFRNHYFLMAMPGLALLNAVFILTIAKIANKSHTARWTKWVLLCLSIFIVGDLVVDNAKMWLKASPAQLSKELYSSNPFSEAVPIASYLKDHTSPADTIAVLGSEPEIFFLSHRRSASGYIYMYALTEPQPLAPRMGREFISQIETAQPKYIVSVNLGLSWYSLITPESFQRVAAIQNWWAGYSTNYLLVSAVKISPDKPSQFVWNESLLNSSNATSNDVLIYRRISEVKRGTQDANSL